MTIQKRLETLESKVKTKPILAMPEDFVEFNGLIGLPTRKVPPFEPMPLFEYELDMVSNISSHKYYALNKARGIGATEIILRLILHMAILNKIPQRKFLIITGTRSALAQDHLRRIAEMCERISGLIDHTISDECIRVNNSEIIAMPASPAAIRGYENVEMIFADEAAHWNLVEDDSVLQAIEPHRTKSDAHIVIVSTPNGMRGFFAKIFHNPATKYHTQTIQYDLAPELISQDEVAKVRAEDYYRFEQEYNCKFLTTKYSAFPSEVLDKLEQNSQEYQLYD